MSADHAQGAPAPVWPLEPAFPPPPALRPSVLLVLAHPAAGFQANGPRAQSRGARTFSEFSAYSALAPVAAGLRSRGIDICSPAVAVLTEGEDHPLLRRRFPSAARWTDFPVVGGPFWKVDPDRLAIAFRAEPDAYPYRLDSTLRATPGIAAVEALRGVGEIALLASPDDPDRDLARLSWLCDLAGRPGDRAVTVFDGGSGRRADAAAAALRRGPTERFHWTYAVNFAVLASRALAEAIRGERSGSPAAGDDLASLAGGFFPMADPLALQILYRVARQTASPTWMGSAFDAFERDRLQDGLTGAFGESLVWPGTGAHPPWAMAEDPAAAERMAQGLRGLRRLELVHIGYRNVELTTRGAAFLGLLHPDCEDPDLPLRWRAPQSADVQAIDRWCRGFFRKLKRSVADLPPPSAQKGRAP